MIFSFVSDGVDLSMYRISYQSPIWIVFPSILRGILIFTSNMLVLGPVSVRKEEFASNTRFERVVRIPPSDLNSNTLKEILSSSLESLLESGS